MRIANPIYDSVFRYLLSDPDVARLIVSTIIDQEVIELESRTNEQIGHYGPALSVYRLDFCARIRLANGDTQLVLIEIQKAKLPDDIRNKVTSYRHLASNTPTRPMSSAKCATA